MPDLYHDADAPVLTKTADLLFIAVKHRHQYSIVIQAGTLVIATVVMQSQQQY